MEMTRTRREAAMTVSLQNPGAGGCCSHLVRIQPKQEELIMGFATTRPHASAQIANRRTSPTPLRISSFISVSGGTYAAKAIPTT